MLEDYLHTRPCRPSNYPEGDQPAPVTRERGAQATTKDSPDVDTTTDKA